MRSVTSHATVELRIVKCRVKNTRLDLLQVLFVGAKEMQRSFEEGRKRGRQENYRKS